MDPNTQNQPTPPIPVTQNNATSQQNPGGGKPHQKKLAVLIAIVLFLLTAGGIVASQSFLNKQKTNTPLFSVDKSTEAEADKPEPTIMPFRELTIPYLREREYSSTVGKMEAAYDNLNYTAFLTSYTSDGLKINALLTKPMTDMPEGGWPAIVFIHGYIPPSQYETIGQAYSAYVDYLARNGFVVFKIDLRGHGDSEGEAGGGYYGSDYVIDALHAYAALQTVDFVNKDKIGMWGHSMAGNILLRSAAVKRDIPAINIWAGAVYSYVDQRKYGIQDNSYRPPENNTQRQNRRRELFDKHGSPSAESVFWQQVAPTNYLQDIQSAIELNHAVDDDVVDIGYSRDLDELLDKTKVEHQLFEYPSGGHNISGESFNAAMERTVSFYKKYLQ